MFSDGSGRALAVGLGIVFGGALGLIVTIVFDPDFNLALGIVIGAVIGLLVALLLPLVSRNDHDRGR